MPACNQVSRYAGCGQLSPYIFSASARIKNPPTDTIPAGGIRFLYGYKSPRPKRSGLFSGAKVLPRPQSKTRPSPLPPQSAGCRKQYSSPQLISLSCKFFPYPVTISFLYTAVTKRYFIFYNGLCFPVSRPSILHRTARSMYQLRILWYRRSQSARRAPYCRDVPPHPASKRSRRSENRKAR